MNFAELISASRTYLSCFDYDHYPACFQAFENDAAPLFDALEGGRAELPRKVQKTAAEEEKQVFALFLAPAALRRGGAAQTFSEALCRQWNTRYPRNTFLAGNYETILKGFDSNLLGLPLRKSKFRR